MVFVAIEIKFITCNNTNNVNPVMFFLTFSWPYDPAYSPCIHKKNQNVLKLSYQLRIIDGPI